jgi:hypothetical protein
MSQAVVIAADEKARLLHGSSGKILSRNAITCNLTDSAPIGTPCAEKVFASNIRRDSAT